MAPEGRIGPAAREAPGVVARSMGSRRNPEGNDRSSSRPVLPTRKPPSSCREVSIQPGSGEDRYQQRCARLSRRSEQEPTHAEKNAVHEKAADRPVDPQAGE